MKHTRVTLALAGIAISLTCAGCGVHAVSASANQAAPTPSPEICALKDLTKIRTKAAEQPKIDLTNAPQDVLDARFNPHDPRSFIAVVTAADLTEAGINTSGIPQDQKELVVVEHGSWLSTELPLSGAAGTGTGPAPTPVVYSWIVQISDAGTYRPRTVMYAVDNPCFNGG